MVAKDPEHLGLRRGHPQRLQLGGEQSVALALDSEDQVPQLLGGRRGRRGREGQGRPEPLDGCMIEPIARFLRDHPPQFPRVKAPGQACEALQLLNGRFRPLTTAPSWAHVDMGGEEATHPLRCNTSCALADRVGMEMRVCGSLGRGALVQEDRANDLIASWHWVVKASWQWVAVRQRFHRRVLPYGGPGPA